MEAGVCHGPSKVVSGTWLSPKVRKSPMLLKIRLFIAAWAAALELYLQIYSFAPGLVKTYQTIPQRLIHSWSLAHAAVVQLMAPWTLVWDYSFFYQRYGPDSSQPGKNKHQNLIPVCGIPLPVLLRDPFCKEYCPQYYNL